MTLSHTSNRLQTLVDSIQDYAVFMLDPTGEVVTWNAGAERIKGYRAEEIVGRNFSIFYPPADRAAGLPQRVLARAAAQGRYQFEGWRVRKDGSLFWADITLTALFDPDHTLIGYGKVTRDLTERRQAEQRLAESERRFRALLEAAPDAIVAFDPTGVVRMVNSQTELLFGRNRADLVGSPVERLLWSEVDGEPWRVSWPIDTTGDEARSDLAGRSSAGRWFPAEVRLAPLQTDEGAWAIVLIRDITVRRRVEAERLLLVEREQEARADATAAERALRVRDEFLSVAAHELKTPVASLIATVQFLARSLRRHGALTAEQTQDNLQVVVAQAWKLNRLVEQLLDTSRIEAGRLTVEMTPLDVVELCQGVLRQFSHNLPEREFTLNADAQPVMVLGDALRLEQVVTNLLDNAVKYSPQGGLVVVTVATAGGEATVAVADQGIGIPPAEVGRIFEPYYQAHAGNFRSGLGLGLYVSQQIASLHHGALDAESVEGAGTTVTLRLPRYVGTS